MSFMLSENGWRKAKKHLSPECWGENNWTTSDEPIFEPEDFKGAVVLTIEEAKALLRRIPEFKESGGWQLPIERLKERIKKAE